MNPGKITEAQCKRSVLQLLPPPGPHVIQGAGVGHDYSAMAALNGGQYVSAMAVCTLNTKSPEQYAFWNALNRLETSGIKTHAIMVNVLLPARGNESRIKDITRKLAGLCKQYEVEYIGGHTELIDALRMPVITVTAFGEGERTLFSKDNVKPDQGILMIGHAGTEAALMLVNDKWEALHNRYSEDYLQGIKQLEMEMSLRRAYRLLIKEPAAYIHAISTGGVFAALWELGESTGCGIEVDLKAVPIRQETIEVCEFFDLNPYMVLSGGSALVVTPEPERMVTNLKQMGISARMIGQTTVFNDKIVMNGDEVRYLEPPKGDDIYKIYMNRGQAR